jgi:N-acetylmuramoyl-L-alanine amidase
MNLISISKSKVKILLFFVLLIVVPFNAQNKKFTLVIDAGHGGHDPGAKRGNSLEKDINLKTSLYFGQLVEDNFDDVKVVYTRKTDKYLTLQERADIVNINHADLFVCIHTNAAKAASAYGTETYTLGLAKSKGNLDVAMRENSVILLEDDYKSKYKGFDPSSTESYIMFEFMQDKYIDKSIDLASSIQNQFTKYANRSDRGVRQAGFWVLLKSACPSVLIELGFVSNPAEEKYLTSESGQKEMATSIYNAFVNFKRNHDKKSGKLTNPQNYVEIQKQEKPLVEFETQTQTETETESTEVSEQPEADAKTVLSQDVKPIFKLQLFASKSKLKANAPEFKGLKELEYYIENDLYKYTIGFETDYEKIVQLKKDNVGKFPEAFIVAFLGNKKLSAKEALKIK